jgi:NAD+ diphosphatase
MSLPLHLPLAQSVIDRDGAARDSAELFDQLWLETATRILVLHNGKTLVSKGSLRLLSTDQSTAGKYRVYLGRTTTSFGYLQIGTAIVLSVLSDNAAQAIEPNDANWQELRRSGAGLRPEEAALISQALAIHNWHETHQYCPNCGAVTIIAQGGWSRICLQENRQLFPRTDAAVIVSIIDDQDRILLGSQGSWAENRWSILAGFVEAAESLESAVRREMLEECGLMVTDPVYLGSQAWPYPYSLMLGFTARLAPESKAEEIKPDGIEIAKLRWFSREELRDEAEQMLLPTRISIARALIEHWFGESIESASEKEMG